MLGVSSVRLLPKKRGIRAIANLSKRQRRFDPERSNSSSSKLSSGSPNSVLTPLYNVLKFECSIERRCLGFSVMGLDDVHKKVHAFHRHLNCASFSNGVGARSCNGLYFISVDLKQCFDRMNQKRLFECACNKFAHESYVVQKSTAVYSLASVQRRRIRVSFDQKVSIASFKD